MVPEIDQQRFAEAHAAGAPVIDVRGSGEYRTGHVPGARCAPLPNLPLALAELPKDRPLYVICQSGGRSAQATSLLRGLGYDAHSVSGGTAAWIEAGRPAVTGDTPTAPGGHAVITVLPVETPGLGDRTYLAHDGSVALVVDPQRDHDRVTALAEAAGVRITHVFETHIHNDYVTGGLALARETGAQYLVNADDEVSYERTPIRDGQVVEVGDTLRVRVIHTPGHTHTHLSYALEADGEQIAVFTGGSLLYGTTGRPDLLGPDHTDTLVRAQWHSAHRLARELPDDTAVYPTHGFGSFCSATQATGLSSTIGEEKRTNTALTAGEEAYVEQLLAGLDAFPAYYAHMGPANAAGPGKADLSAPSVADPAELRRRIEAGEWVVDLRERTAFAAGHLAGSLNFGLDGQFVTYLGWLIPWGTPLTLLGESAADVAEAQRELVRIGIDRPAAMATGTPGDWAGGEPLASYPRATFADLKAAPGGDGLVVLDVRRDQERAEAHLPGSLHIPLHQLPGRLDEIPAGRVWVHCAGGYRAGIAAALLSARGRDVVAVDDSFDNAHEAGLCALPSLPAPPATPRQETHA
ncbi:rhodanese-like domain-containing protein [Streptomyces sp. B93]|uniref:rhodanese-like domain-containing protein n=1 Tax=Streptomyces sp. B93 TaxID=2824875 RepID=UPI001B38B489|nr:rhodanese-like domain-containing protein [Streptomyces sp. B93]MBQ1090536.1 MBL fold metallo-hydrolase [Streptomyces sp. B93]